MSRRAAAVLVACVIGANAVVAQAQDARTLAPWLDVPAAWSRKVENGVVAVSPDDLPTGASLLLLVEPAMNSNESLAEAYDQALRDLGPWRPVGNPVEQKFDNGWVFRLGVGVVTLETGNFTAETAVARRGDLRVRFWALADSDNTFNRYKNAVGTAIASAQDISHPPAKAPAPAQPPPGAGLAQRATPTAEAGNKPPPGFGKGISGVYVGVERGLSASAGVGSGPHQVFNQSTGRYETSNTGTATVPTAQIGDYLEVDVFYADGTYRRRLPIRGLNSDISWEKTQQLPLWGTWERKGNQVIVRRGSYTATYTSDGEALVSERGRVWAKLPLQTGLKLDGTFARDDFRDADAPRITLRPDGAYQEHRNFLRMVGSPWHLVEPDADAMIGKWNDAQFQHAMAASSGAYSFDNFTLTLRAKDGRIWQINTYIPAGEAAPKPRRLIINGYHLVRDK